MADKDFVVKNGIVVNTGFAANSTQFTLGNYGFPTSGISANSTGISVGTATANVRIDNTSFSGQANSTKYVAGYLATFVVNSSMLTSYVKTENLGLSKLPDVTIDNIQTDQSLKWDGSKWVNSLITGSGGGTGAVGGASDKLFWENGTTMTADYSITAGKNAGTFGPITLNPGVTVTIPSDSTWSVV